MRYAIIIASLICLSIKSNCQSKSIEDKIVDTIFKLKEVRERANYIEKISKGTRHLSIFIYSKPSKNKPYYWIKAWEDNGNNYHTHYNFYVYPKTFTIKFLDVEKGIPISLKEWRKHLTNQSSN